MYPSHAHTLVDRGRKAGLHTAELYQALATRPPEAHPYARGQADGNGYAAQYHPDGRRAYHPLHGPFTD